MVHFLSLFTPTKTSCFTGEIVIHHSVIAPFKYRITNILFFHSSGFFNDPSCPTTTINHAVNIVGYGTDPTHGDFWVIRNSWGTSWGVSGYMIMKRGVNMCAINGWSAYPMIR